MPSSTIATCFWNCCCAELRPTCVLPESVRSIFTVQPWPGDELGLRRARRALAGEPGGPEVVARARLARRACRAARRTRCACRRPWRRGRGCVGERRRPWSSSHDARSRVRGRRRRSAAGAVVVVVGARGRRGRGGGRSARRGRASCSRDGGASASTGRNRSSAVLPTSALGLVAVLHAGQVDDDVVALAGDLGLGDAEAVDPVADDVDRDVEGVGLVLARPATARPRCRPGGRGRAPVVLPGDERATNVPTTSTSVTTRNMTFLRTAQSSGLVDGGSSSVGLVGVDGVGALGATSDRRLRDRGRGPRVITTPRRDLELDPRRRRARGWCRRSRRW